MLELGLKACGPSGTLVKARSRGEGSPFSILSSKQFLLVIVRMKEEDEEVPVLVSSDDENDAGGEQSIGLFITTPLSQLARSRI